MVGDIGQFPGGYKIMQNQSSSTKLGQNYHLKKVGAHNSTFWAFPLLIHWKRAIFFGGPCPSIYNDRLGTYFDSFIAWPNWVPGKAYPAGHSFLRPEMESQKPREKLVKKGTEKIGWWGKLGNLTWLKNVCIYIYILQKCSACGGPLTIWYWSLGLFVCVKVSLSSLLPLTTLNSNFYDIKYGCLYHHNIHHPKIMNSSFMISDTCSHFMSFVGSMPILSSFLKHPAPPKNRPNKLRWHHKIAAATVFPKPNLPHPHSKQNMAPFFVWTIIICSFHPKSYPLHTSAIQCKPLLQRCLKAGKSLQHRSSWPK